MTLTELIAAKRAEVEQHIEARDKALARQRGIITTARTEGRSELSKIEATEYEQLRGEAESAEKRHDTAKKALDELERAAADESRIEGEQNDVRDTGAGNEGAGGGSKPAGERRAYDQQHRIGAEERVYTAYSARQGTSFFVDAYRAQFKSDFRAQERLQRHDAEVRVEHEANQTRATSTSSYAGLIPPAYLVEQAVLVARAGRPTANVVQHLPLPADGMSLVVPRGTTGASAAVQASENSQVSATDQAWGNVTVPVVTIAGQQDISRQSLERGAAGIDQLVFADLAGAYAVALDAQVLAGTGSSGQMLGILQTSGINQATAFTAAVTPATFYTKVAGQINAVETTRYMAPNVILMHPRRWNWLLSQTDSSNRPYVVPNQNGPFNALGVAEAPIDTPSAIPVGTLFGLPVVTDASIPTAVGTGPEDQVIVTRKEDLLLWEEGDGMPTNLQFDAPLANSLAIRLVAYGYAAFTGARFSSAIGVVGGNAGTAGYGLAAPTF